jgi:hypothetical protein
MTKEFKEIKQELKALLDELTEQTEKGHAKFEFDLISWAKNEDEEVDNIYAKFQMLREHDNLTKKQQIAILMHQIVLKGMVEQLGKNLTNTLLEESYPKYCKVTEA